MVKNLLTSFLYFSVSTDAFGHRRPSDMTDAAVMIERYRTPLRGFALAIAFGAIVGLTPFNANADSGFQKWIANFYDTAARSGITKATYRKAFAGVTDP